MAPSISSQSKTIVWEQNDSGTFIRTKSKGGVVFQSEYRCTEILGKGSTGAVFELKSKDFRVKPKAIKFFSDVERPRQSAICLREKKVCAFLNAHCPSFKGYVKSADLPKVLIFRCLNVSLSSLIAKYSFWKKMQMFDGLATQLQEMHSAGLAHGDIHAGNVMLDLKNRFYFIDFGFSTLKEEAPTRFEERRFDDNLSFYNLMKLVLNAHFEEEVFKQNPEMLKSIKEICKCKSDGDVKPKIASFISQYRHLFEVL